MTQTDPKSNTTVLSYSCCTSPIPRERKCRRTFSAIFSSPLLISAYVVGNSRRSEPSTTHTLYRRPAWAASPESSSASKNRGGGCPYALQNSVLGHRETQSSQESGRTGTGRESEKKSLLALWRDSNESKRSGHVSILFNRGWTPQMDFMSTGHHAHAMHHESCSGG